MAQDLAEIIRQIPPNGIDDFSLAAANGVSLVWLRHCLSRCPNLESREICKIVDHPTIKGKIITIIERVWYPIDGDPPNLRSCYDFSTFFS